MTQGEIYYEGNEKTVYLTDEENVVLFHFKDVVTAFHNVKTTRLANKGVVCNKISALLMNFLQENGVETHFLKLLSDREQLCKKIEIVPLFIVVRNYVAGSLAKRLDLEVGSKPSCTIYNLHYNNDLLGDPLISDTEAVALGLVSEEELGHVYAETSRVNRLLTGLCDKAGLKLVDFKLEFGRDASTGKLIVSDEISPDTSRFWDAATDEILDKDRFRHDLGYIVAHYETVLNKLEAAVAA